MDWTEKLNRILAFIVLGLATFALVAQDTLPFPQENWDQATDGLKYGPVQDPDAPVERHISGSGFSFTGGDWLLYLIMAILLALIIFLIIKAVDKRGASGKSKIGARRDYSFEELEENLKEMDLDDYLRTALSQEDYRAAVRLYYLKVIQQLDHLALIQWKRDKTNRDYIRELSSHPKNPHFQRLTINYEYVWYGDISLSVQQFEALEPSFKEFMNALNSPHE